MIRAAPRIETDRLILRDFRPDDLGSLHDMWTNDDVVRFVGGQKLSREDTWRKALAAHGLWLLIGFGYWVAEHKADGRLIGQIGFADFKRDMVPSIEGEPELGYVFHPSVHGMGIAREACGAALAWADEHLPEAVIPAIIDHDNVPSTKLAERLGFVRQPDAIYRDAPITLWRRPAR